MKARVNFTGRKRIGRRLVQVRMLKVPRGEPRLAHVELNLDNLGFPADASVVLEAYSGPNNMRFSCGTVGDLQVPSQIRLNEIGDQERVLFRLKVVDTRNIVGRLIGVAEHITPLTSARKGEESRRNLLPVEPADDMGEVVWRVDLEDGDGGGPVLRINSKVLDSDESILHDTLSMGIMLPEALRQILVELISEQSPTEEHQGDWREDWMVFCRDELGQGMPQTVDEEEQRAWVDDCTSSFCKKFKFTSKIVKQRERGEQ